MRLLLAVWLFTRAAAAQELPQAVDLVQRIDQTYPWLQVAGLDVDAQGDIYLAGSAMGAIPATVSIRFGPLGGTDIVVIKLDPTGRQIYGTAIGGSQDESVGGIKTDSVGNLYLFGSTNSPDYPAIGSQGSGPDEVVLKLDGAGNMLYNTRLDWAEAISTIGLDPVGNVYMGGIPRPGALPVSSGAYRQAPDGSGGFIVKLDQSGKLAAATYTEEQVLNVVTRGYGDILFSMGKTIAALDTSLSELVLSTLTDLNLYISNIGLDGSNNIYAATGAAVRKYAPDGKQLLWARDFPLLASFPHFAVTPSGTAFLYGGVPPNYPTHNGTQACWHLLEPIDSPGAAANGFLMAIGPDGDIRYGTFMAEDIPLYLPIIVSADGRAYTLAHAIFPFLPIWQAIVRFDANELPSAHPFAGCLVNAGSLLVTPIAPGTIMTLFGEQMGPETGASFTLQDGHVPFDIAGASITVDGKPAPVLYAQAGQINFIAPWSLRTDRARVPICFVMNAASSCLYAPTALVSAGLFMVNSQIAAINPDGTINSPDHPAPSNSYVSVYLTGGGQIQGPVVDGGVAGSDLQQLTATVFASLTGPSCFGAGNITGSVPVLFAGVVPTLIYGANVAIVQTRWSSCPTATSTDVYLTLSIQATPQSGAFSTWGTLYIH